MSNKVLFLLLFFTTISCISENKFEKEVELFGYLAINNKIKLAGETKYLVFIIYDYCSACTEETVSLINQLVKKQEYTEYNKTIILASNTNEVFKHFHRDYQIIVDENEQLARHGLNIGKGAFFEIKGKKILFWDKLENEKIRLHFEL